MPKKQPYDQYCPIARALDLVGDRWNLLIVRELFVGPMRYGELLEALRPISTDMLAKPLRELDAAGVISSQGGGYGLTDEGRRLGPVLQTLARWGRPHLGGPASERDLSAARAVQMLAVAGSDDPPPGAEATIELRVGEFRSTLTAGPDSVEASRMPADAVDAALVVVDDRSLWAIASGQLDWAEAVASGAVEVDGDAEAAERLLAGRLPVGP